MKALFYGLAIVAGLGNPVQSAANAALNKALGHPMVSALMIYISGLTAWAVVSLFWGLPVREALGRAGDVPWWGWIGGACGLTFVLSGALATKEIGSGAFTVASLVAAVVLSIVLDHFGIMGLEQRAATWPRIAGAALAMAGVVLVARY